MTDNIMRKLWWVPALALLAACDPFDDAAGGTPVVLSVIGATVDETDILEAVEDANGTDGWSVAGVATPAVFIVKTNKLLSGLSIQSTASSCVPAPGLNLTVNAAPAPANWYACYQPGSGTTAEGSSLVIYQGIDIAPGIVGVGRGYLESAQPGTGTPPRPPGTPIAPGDYVITAAPTDQSGTVLNVSFSANVVAPPP